MAFNYSRDAGPAFENKVKNVALVGATGQLGKVFAEHILKTGKHNLTAVTRIGSQIKVPEGVKMAEVDYDDESMLVAALTDQDFLVITLSLTAPPDVHSKLVRAAARAGVRYVVPNAYGIDFYGKPKLLEDIPALHLGVGPFTYGFDFPNKTVTLFDDGKTRVNTTTWPQLGRALAALISLKRIPEDENDKSVTLAQFVNKPVYISSFCLNQREMLDGVNNILEKADDDWKVLHQPAAERSKEGWEELKKGDGRGFLKGMYARVFQSPSDGIFETHNDLLGLPREDIAQAVQAAHNWALSSPETRNPA